MKTDDTMDDISLENIPKIFDTDAIEDIEQYRQKRNECPFDWKEQKALVSSCEDLKLVDGQYRYTIVHHDVPFEALFLPAKSKRLVVSFCGGRPYGTRYPLFLRWKQYHYYQACYLCIDDPMQSMHTNRQGVYWYYGDKTRDFSAYIEDILRQFLHLLHIGPEDLVFLGSSGGGSMAVRMAGKFNGSCAIAMNPQFRLGTWGAEHKAWFQKELQVDLMEEDMFGRHTVYPLQNESRFFLLLNSASPKDRGQFMPFLQHRGIPLKYGISQFQNIVTWIHHTRGESLHSSNPEKEALPLLMFLNEEMKKGKDINKLNGISLILNDYLELSYSNQKALKEQIRKSKSIKRSFVNIFSFVKYLFLSQICFGSRRSNYRKKLKDYLS